MSKLTSTQYLVSLPINMGFPGGSDGKESTCNAGDLGSVPGLGRLLDKRRLPTPVFWPREFHGQSSLRVYSAWGPKE